MAAKSNTGLGDGPVGGADALFDTTQPLTQKEQPTAGKPTKKKRSPAPAVELQTTLRTPPSDRGKPIQTSMLLYDDQNSWLDDTFSMIRSRGGDKRIRKASIIRVLLDLAMTLDVDVTEVTSEAELFERFKQALNKK